MSILLPACCQQSSTGKTNKEQVVLVFWWVDNALVARMRNLLGSTLQTITSKALLVTVIKDTAVMANDRTEPALCLVQRRELQKCCDEEPRAIFSHCYGHAAPL